MQHEHASRGQVMTKRQYPRAKVSRARWESQAIAAKQTRPISRLPARQNNQGHDHTIHRSTTLLAADRICRPKPMTQSPHVQHCSSQTIRRSPERPNHPLKSAERERRALPSQIHPQEPRRERHHDGIKGTQGHERRAQEKQAADEAAATANAILRSMPLSSDRMALEPDRLLGRGTFGIVYSLRDSQSKQSVRRIIKVSTIRNDREKDVFDREIHYLKKLQTCYWQQETSPHFRSMSRWQPLVPRLHWSTTENLHGGERQGIQVMEEWQGTLTELGLQQARPFRISHKGVVYFRQQILSQVAIVHAIDRERVIHGDLKRRNMLYRYLNRPISTAPLALPDLLTEHPMEIVLSDWGFGGQIHTGKSRSRPRIGFPEALASYWGRRLPAHLWPYLNRWQLYYDMIHNRPTYVIQPEGHRKTERSELARDYESAPPASPRQRRSRSPHSMVMSRHHQSAPVPEFRRQVTKKQEAAESTSKTAKTVLRCCLITPDDMRRLLHLPTEIVDEFADLIDHNPHNPCRLKQPHQWLNSKQLRPMYRIHTDALFDEHRKTCQAR